MDFALLFHFISAPSYANTLNQFMVTTLKRIASANFRFLTSYKTWFLIHETSCLSMKNGIIFANKKLHEEKNHDVIVDYYLIVVCR